jgi:hypothetical protein
MVFAYLLSLQQVLVCLRWCRCRVDLHKQHTFGEWCLPDLSHHRKSCCYIRNCFPAVKDQDHSNPTCRSILAFAVAGGAAVGDDAERVDGVAVENCVAD